MRDQPPAPEAPEGLQLGSLPSQVTSVKGRIARPATQQRARRWAHPSAGKTRTLTASRCFGNQLASLQTLSQIHLHVIETRASEFQPSGHAQGPEGSVH